MTERFEEVSSGESASSPSTELLSVVADAVVPVLLLRRSGDDVSIEASTGATALEAAAGQTLATALTQAEAAELLVPLTDATIAAATHRDVIRLDLVDRAACRMFEAHTLRFLPIGGDASGAVDLVLVLRDNESTVHDELTGLPGRDLLADRWAMAVTRARRLRSGIAVLFIDLDGFKLVNDNLGHPAGDVVLTTIADRLRTVVRTQDTVARYGGDEFVVLIEGDEATAHLIAGRILDAVVTPITVEAQGGGVVDAAVGASIGISVVDLVSADTDGLEAAISAADGQMYEAKRSGGRCLRVAG